MQKYFSTLLIASLGFCLVSCTTDTVVVSIQKSNNPEMYSYMGNLGKPVILKRSQETGEYFDSDGFIIYNPQYCGGIRDFVKAGQDGIYDWYDSENKEAGCFNTGSSEYKEYGHYKEDSHGIYYQGKEGGGSPGYRLTKNTGLKIVTISKKDTGLDDDMDFYMVGNEIIYGGSILKGLHNLSDLQILNYGVFKDNQKVWSDGTEIVGADTSSFRIKSSTGDLYVDKNNCYLAKRIGGYIQIPNCNPKKIKVIITSKSDEYGQTKYYFSDGINNWGDMGDLLN